MRLHYTGAPEATFASKFPSHSAEGMCAYEEGLEAPCPRAPIISVDMSRFQSLASCMPWLSLYGQLPGLGDRVPVRRRFLKTES